MSYFKTDEEAFNRFNCYLNDQELSHKQLTPDIVFGWIREQNHIPLINTSLNQRLVNEMQITAHKFYVAYLHWYYKSKHFHLEKDTANMLVQTDVHSVKGSDLNIPFPCFYLTVPEDIVTVSFTGDEGECSYEGVSQGVYVIEVERKGKIYWNIVASLEVRNYKNKTQPGKVMVGVNLPVGKHIDIFESAKKVFDKSFPNTSLLSDPSQYYYNKTSRAILERFLLLLVNTLLYLKSDKAITRHISPPVSKKKNRTMNSKSEFSSPYIRVGAKITINSAQRKAYKEANTLLKGVNSKNNKPSHQWIVRGHWRNQAYGEGLKDRKLIWIQPYVKGEGPLVQKDYVIK